MDALIISGSSEYSVDNKQKKVEISGGEKKNTQVIVN